MSEIPTSAPKSDTTEAPDNVHLVDFGDIQDRMIRVDPTELADESVEAFLLGSLSHPGKYFGPSSKIAEYIQNLLGAAVRNNLTSKDLEWRKRMMAIKVDLEELHPDESDFLISADSVLSELHAAFIDTRSRATELKKERYALGLLKEFRAGIIIHNQHDQPPDMRWHELIHRLVGDIES